MEKNTKIGFVILAVFVGVLLVFVILTTLNGTAYLQKIKAWNAADSNVTELLLNSTKKFENGSIDSKIGT